MSQSDSGGVVPTETSSEPAVGPTTPAALAESPRPAPPSTPQSVSPVAEANASQLARRMRARIARLGGRAPQTPPILEPVIRALHAVHPREDVGVLLRAFDVAQHWHEGQMRKSGDPYITHPVAVTTILAELGYLPNVLAAALLHDTVEDTDYSLAQLEHDFGPEIAVLVDGVTKLDKVKYGDSAQAETVRKMLIAMHRDVRVLVIKLADRLHNARTWKFVAQASAAKKARETLEIYAPLAHRLGLNKIKWELENLSFKVLYPARYEEIENLVSQHAPERERYLALVRERLASDLTQAKIAYAISGRPKHFYSIYQKMVVGGKAFEDVHDLVGVRVLVDTVSDCYAVLGAVHSRYNPIAGRFKDYISVPKFNLYQSLHTTVIGPEGKNIEIQIRTHDMHRKAEYGVAAHWRYKARKGGEQEQSAEEAAMPWVRGIMEWQSETGDPLEFLDALRYEVASEEIFVYTPKGKCVALVKGSTPIDFAYAVHTEVGHRTIGAKINGRLSSLETKLKTGETVEIMVSKAESAGPSPNWASIVASPRAKAKIRQWFSKERREESMEKGKENLSRHMRKQSLPLRRLLAGDKLKQIASDLNFNDVDDLLYAMGEGHIQAEVVTKRLMEMHGGEDGAAEDLAEATIPGVTKTRLRRGNDPHIRVEGMDDVLVKLAKCCTPVPGDSISGFVTRGQGVSVHQSECSNLASFSPDTKARLVSVSWGRHNDVVYTVQIQVEALDRPALLSDVTRTLAEMHVNILAASVNTTRDRVAYSTFSFEMASTSHLSHLLSAVRRLNGVYDVKRIAGNHRRGDEH